MSRSTLRSSILLLALVAPSCSLFGGSPDEPPPPPIHRLPSGVLVEELLIGPGLPAVNGQQVVVHYEGRLFNGTTFDSSRDRGIPFEFQLGEGRVVPGWEDGIIGMRRGGFRRLTIPAELAYGAEGRGGVIPPGATLVIEVELIEVRDPPSTDPFEGFEDSGGSAQPTPEQDAG